MSQIKINISNLRMRQLPSLKGTSMGFADKGIHEYTSTENADGYTWYKIENNYWVAGIKGDVEVLTDEWIRPTPVNRDTSREQIYIGDVILRIRSDASTKAKAVGFCEENVYYNILDLKKDDYAWYKIGEDAWCAGVEEVEYLPVNAWVKPEPVEENINKDQIFVGDVSLNIRSEASTKSEKIDICVKNSWYDVANIQIKDDYTWYDIGNAWVAGVEEVLYQAAGNHTKSIKPLVNKLQSNLDLVIKALDKNRTNRWSELTEKVNDLNNFIEENFDKVDWDFVDDKQYDEVDLIYTTDIHGYSKGYCESNRVQTNFSWQDLNTYRNKLAKSNIKSLLVNCGDIIHGSAPANANYGEDTVGWFNNLDMFASVFGNHEWRYNDEGPWFQKRVTKIDSMTCCNLLNKSNNKPVFKPYRTAKIGSTRIGVIGVGFPGFDGDRGNTSEYTILAGKSLYNQIQKYIDELKELDMDYIFCLVHLGKTPDDRAGGETSIISIVQNTSGLSAILPGHSHEMTQQETYKDKSGKTVYALAQPRCDLAYISRVRLRKSGITSELIDHI